MLDPCGEEGGASVSRKGGGGGIAAGGSQSEQMEGTRAAFQQAGISWSHAISPHPAAKAQAPGHMAPPVLALTCQLLLDGVLGAGMGHFALKGVHTQGPWRETSRIKGWLQTSKYPQAINNFQSP